MASAEKVHTLARLNDEIDAWLEREVVRTMAELAQACQELRDILHKQNGFLVSSVLPPRPD